MDSWRVKTVSSRIESGVNEMWRSASSRPLDVMMAERTVWPGEIFLRSWVTCPFRKRSRSAPVMRRRVRGPGTQAEAGDLIFWRRFGFIRVGG